MLTNIESQKWCCIGLGSAAWISWIVASVTSRPSRKSLASDIALAFTKQAVECCSKLMADALSETKQVESAQLIPLRTKVVS